MRRKWYSQPGANTVYASFPAEEKAQVAGGKELNLCPVLIFFMAKQMPMSEVLTQALRRGEKFTLNINFLSSLSPVRTEYSPGGLCLLKFPPFQLCESGGGVWRKFPKEPQSPRGQRKWYLGKDGRPWC